MWFSWYQARSVSSKVSPGHGFESQQASRARPAGKCSVESIARAAKAAAKMSAAATTIVLLRHGETDWNRELRIQGQTLQIPLNLTGRRQAQVVAEHLKHFPLDAVYTSDLLRTVQTAEAVAHAHPRLTVQQNAGLRERHLGVLQGLTSAEAAQQQPDALRALLNGQHSDQIPGGGESVQQLQKRVVSTVEQIAAVHPGQQVLLVTHGGTLHACYQRAVGHSYRGKNVNCAINRIQVEGQHWALLEWGVTSHLDAQGAEYQLQAFGGGNDSG